MRESENDVVSVVFRTYPDGDVIAVMPGLDANGDGRFCTCYMHVGQHGAADYHAVIRQTRPATDAERAPLQRELEGKPYEYKFRVMRRWTRRR